MREAIADGFKYLSDDDLAAIADYLLAQPPIVHEVRPSALNDIPPSLALRRVRATAIARTTGAVLIFATAHGVP